MPPIYSIRGRVYWSETDAAEIAHFTSFFKYCEKTEEEFILTHVGKVKTPPGRYRIVFPRVHAECDYEAPLRVHDEYRVDIADVKVGNKSITWVYEIHNETLGLLSARCKIVTVAFDKETFQAVEIPEEIRSVLMHFQSLNG